jgi:anaerobic sulfite reductase subunit B
VNAPVLVPDPAALGAVSMVPTPYRVVGRRQDTVDTFTLDLHPVRATLEPPAPGQFAMVWAPGVGEVPISVSGLEGPVWQLTIRPVGATTRRIVDEPVGAVLGLRGPFGHGWSAVPDDRPVVVVAGGVGLAPLRLHIDAIVAARRDRPAARVAVVVGARTPDELLFADDLERWSSVSEVYRTVDRPQPGWTGEVGLVTAPLGRLGLARDTHAALCGPEIMMRVAANDLVRAGLEPDAVEVSLERSMACAVAHCGRCQLGPVMLCRDGPVMPWSGAAPLVEVRRW